jgi:hypothetical protein
MLAKGKTQWPLFIVPPSSLRTFLLQGLVKCCVRSMLTLASIVPLFAEPTKVSRLVFMGFFERKGPQSDPHGRK